MKTLKRTFKYALKINNEKLTRAEVEVELKEDSNGKAVFSATGDVYAGRSHVMGGQCLQEIRKYLSDPQFITIYNIWKDYHLNDMNPGTKIQMNYLKEHGAGCSYEEACELLKSAGIYDDNGNKYGYSWYYEEIPDEILTEIKELLR